jgi:hypothetical protein
MQLNFCIKVVEKNLNTRESCTFCHKDFGVNAAYKMLLKLTAGVNFTNDLQATYKSGALY